MRLTALKTAACFAFMMAALSSASPAYGQSADLVVNQTDNPDPGPAGGVFTYTLRVDNNGPDAAIGVTLSDTLPPGSTFVGVTATQGSCSEAGGTLSCALGDIAFLANATVTVQVVLPTAGVWTNTATATSSTADPNTANNLNVGESTTAQNAADVELTATESADPVAAGQNYNYLLTVRNNGPDALAATDPQTVTFSIPAGSCVRSQPTGTAWSCTPATGYPRCTGTITCTRSAALAAGATAAVITVPAVANVAGSVAAAFQAASPVPDGNTANNTASATTSVTGGSSNLTIRKTASPATVAVGSNVTYTITPTYSGGEPPGTLAPNVITVTDTLDSRLAFVSASGSGWSCTFSTPVLTCTRPGPFTGAPFANFPAITLVAQVTATGTIPNTAIVTGPENDPHPGNNDDSVNITGSLSANLRMTKAVTRNPVVVGQATSYTLTVRNLGPSAVASTNVITVTDTLPAGLELTAQPSGTGWTCTPNAGFPLAGPVPISCTRPGPLAVDANAPVLTVPSRATAAATYVNNACVALSGSGPVDGTPANDCGSVSLVASSAQADLRLASKTASPSPVQAGSDLTYVITVANNGPDAAMNVTVTDALTSLVTAAGFQSATPSQGTCTPSTVTAGPTVNLSCNLGTLNAAATATVTVVVRPTRATSGNRSNTATVASPEIGDPLPDNNSFTVNSSVTAVADVQVTKTATPSPVQAGTELTYVVTARNNGPSTAQNVTISDPLPAGTAFVRLVSVTAGSCTVPAAGAVSGSVACSFGAIANGNQQTATFVVRPLTASGGGSITNTITIATTTVDNVPGNNSFSSITPVTAAAVDIIVNKVDSIDPVALGQSTVYTITVTNGGPSYATNIVLVDTFPAGSPSATFSYQGSLALSPAGVGSCSEPALGATSGTLTCTFAGLAEGASATVSYAMRAEAVAAGTSGTSFNTASATSDEPETQPANNQTTHATTSRRTADLAVTKMAPASFTPGVPFSWTIAVTNNGPNDSSGAVVSDALPAGVSFVAASTGCSFGGGTVSCTLGSVPAGTTAIVTIDVVPSSPYVGANPLANAASVAAVNEVDPIAANNSDSATTVPGPGIADVSLVKSGPASVPPNSALTWQLVIANAGPSAADGTTFSDALPAGVPGVTAACSAAGGAVCGPLSVLPGTVSGAAMALPAGGTMTITLNATSPPSGPMTNSATSTAPPGVTDPVPSNNSSAVTTAIPLPDLTIAKVATGTFAQGQSGASYTLTVSNNGAGPTSGTITVTDHLPPSLMATSIGGSGWACVLATTTCTRSDPLVAAASYPPITLTVDIATSAPASVVNTAAVTGGGETNTTNNTSTATTPVTALLPDLTIVKVANGTFAQGQSGAIYTLTVSNSGAGPTSGTITVTDHLPPSLMATSIGGSGWTCVLATTTCTRSDALAPSASYPSITLTVDIATSAPASVVNTAAVTGGGETNTTNNSAAAVSSLLAAAGPAEAIPSLSPAAMAALALLVMLLAASHPVVATRLRRGLRRRATR